MAASLFWVGFPYALMSLTHDFWMLLVCVTLVGIGNNIWHPAAIPTLAPAPDAGVLDSPVLDSAAPEATAPDSSVAAMAPAPTAPTVSNDAVSLGSDTVRPPRSGRAAPVKKGKVRTLYYYDGLPAKWDWSLQTAVAKWNAAGARIHLARVAKAFPTLLRQ